MSTNPYFTQYHTQRFSFIGSPQQRDGTTGKDQRFLNVYPELIKSPISDGKKYYLKKRPGVTSYQTFGAGAGRGINYWYANNTVYTVVGNGLYANASLIQTLNTSTGAVGFCEWKSDTGSQLILCDGTDGWIIQINNAVARITDANFPTPHIPNPVFLDGYIFVAHAGTQTIWNSVLQQPSQWNASFFIDAEMFPFNLQALSKSQNYLVAISTGSIEWFYDNANATGSPLQRNAPAVTQMGCPAPQTVSQTEKQLILVVSTNNGGRTVWQIDGFQPTEIANEPVRQALDAEGSGIINATAFTIQSAGHKWYVLNLKTNARTFVYDFEEQMWHEWSSGLGAACFSYDYATDNPTGNPILIGSAGGASVTLTTSTYTDLGNPINCTIITSKIDFDTEKRKRLYRLSIVGDAPNGNTNTPLTVYWSDDDYNTWSTGTTLNLNGVYPTITQLGYTRRRAFQFVYQQPYPLRLESFEVDVIQEVRR